MRATDAAGQPLDAVVVGGGPAGSSTAIDLARRGWSVLLCDAARFPRDKICGEYLPPAARAHFERLGVWTAIERLGPRRHVGMAVITPGGIEVLGRYAPEGTCGLALRRLDLDAALLQEAALAGARVEQESRLVDLERSGGVNELTFRSRGGTRAWRVRCCALIGADGRNSIVARRLGLRRRARHRRWAIMGHFRRVAMPADHGEMIVTGYGYCGLNPLAGDLTNVCVVFDPGGGPGPMPGRGSMERFFLERIDADPRTRRRLSSALPDGPLRSIGPMACRTASAVSDGALLVGDAAGFFDPFTGEGIAMALDGARLVADRLDRALQHGEVSARALAPYDGMRRQAFDARLRLDRILQALLRRPRLTDWVARRLNRDPSLADLIARVTGDTADARDVLGAGFAARLLLAGRGGGRSAESRPAARCRT